MNSENEIHLLFQRYAEEVGGYLPRRKREDIQMEIVSLLEDSLEDLSNREGRPADEDLAFQVLRDHGAPIKLAQAYRPDDNLMRTDTFQVFKAVAVFVGGLLLLQLLLSIGASVSQPNTAWGLLLLEWLEDILSALGGLVLAFALVERTTPAEWVTWPVDFLGRDWDPAGLKKRLRKKKVNPREYWFESLWLVFLIGLFGLFPQWVGVGGNLNGEWYFLPVLSENYLLYQPWIILYFVARLVFCVALAQQMVWTTRMRVAQIALKVFALGVLLGLLDGPAVIGLNPAYARFHNVPPDMVPWVASGGVLFTAFYLVVGINLAVNIVILLYQILRLFREGSSINGFKITLSR
jgi:hypothetical protein